MKKHIFLVDDDRDKMLFFTEALKHVPISSKCTWAQSGEQALKQLAYLSPDIIFLGLCMPGMDGLQCLKAIKSIPRLKDIPVILHSSAISTDVRLQALNLGARGCWERSDSIPGLADALSSLLGATTATVTI